MNGFAAPFPSCFAAQGKTNRQKGDPSGEMQMALAPLATSWMWGWGGALPASAGHALPGTGFQLAYGRKSFLEGLTKQGAGASNR